MIDLLIGGYYWEEFPELIESHKQTIYWQDLKKSGKARAKEVFAIFLTAKVINSPRSFNSYASDYYPDLLVLKAELPLLKLHLTSYRNRMLNLLEEFVKAELSQKHKSGLDLKQLKKKKKEFLEKISQELNLHTLFTLVISHEDFL